MLASLARRVAALDSLDAVIDTLLQAAIQEIGADRGSLFLHDGETGELYTYISTGLGSRQIRLMDDLGIAGAVFHSAIGEIVHDAYAHPRFHRDVDEQTGYTTKSLVCAPVRNAKGQTIGVAEMLNKVDGVFDASDLALLEGMTSQCAITLEALQQVERTARERQREVDFLNLVSDLTSELELTTLLSRVVSEATRLLDCDRTTLLLNDEKTGELFSYVVDKLELTELRFPNHLGIAGAAFTSGQSIRIPYAYADLRFNPAFDRQSGYFTRCILCVPIFNKDGRTIGVTQSLNKRGGPFSAEDESRLRAFTAQIASALENA
jgi:adenylate cyclase